MLFIKTFLIIYLLLAVYLTGVIIALRELGIWNMGDLKDTIFWLLTVGFVLIFSTEKAKDSKYFKAIFKEGFKWTVILEFAVNFYSFSLLVEFVIIPLFVFIGLFHAVSELDKKHIQLTNILSNILSISGWIIFSYALYKTIVDYENFFTIGTLTSLLLPIIITTLFIPFIYFLALYSAYESFFIRLDFMTTKKEKVQEVKQYIRRVANINLERLNRIMRNFEKRVFYEDIDLKSYIQSIAKKQKASHHNS